MIFKHAYQAPKPPLQPSLKQPTQYDYQGGDSPAFLLHGRKRIFNFLFLGYTTLGVGWSDDGAFALFFGGRGEESPPSIGYGAG